MSSSPIARATRKAVALLFAATTALFATTQKNESQRPAETQGRQAREIPATFFGMHFHHAGTTTPWPAEPIGAWRLWDAYVAWPDLEPQKNQWQFDTLDRDVALAEEHRVELLLVLGQSPAWASTRPRERSAYQRGNAAEPKNLEDWRAFVTAVATRYKGKIRGYEIGNEPNLKQFWTGSVAQMVALTREASRIIHAIDSGAIVVSPSAVGAGGINWLARFLAQGGGQYVDVIGFHFYVDPRAPEAMVPLIHKVKRVMEKNGVDAKPLWNTESGWSRPKPFPSAEMGAAYLARAFLLNWAAGVERFYWYAWDNHDWVSLQTTERDSQTLTPTARAYEVIAKWLVGARLDGCHEDADHIWVCELHRDGVAQWIVWNPRGPRDFGVPEMWRVKTVTPLLGELGAVKVDGTGKQHVHADSAPSLLASD
jgi:Glycosyl hydrolases family 39